MKTIGHSQFFSHVARIEVGPLQVFDERHLNERVWSARTIRLVGHDGSIVEFSVHSDVNVHLTTCVWKNDFRMEFPLNFKVHFW